MFKPNGNQDRQNYSGLLFPPDGYQLEKAVGTTYSLDLEALTAIAIVLGLSEETDSKIMRNPISMLNALQKVSDKIVIFCEAGQIKMPSKPTALSILLEKMVIPVGLPLDRRLNMYPAFHPKTWTLQYVNGEGDRKYRFVVMSRNLTFDRSWDISFAMQSSKEVLQKRKTEPIIDFLEFLKSQIHNTTKDAGKKRNSIAALQNDLKDVSFTLESKEFGEEFEIMPLGIGKHGYDMNEDVLFCNDKTSSDYTFHELVVMSPFLTGKIIEQFNEKGRGLTDCKRTLITRKSELSKLKESQVDNFNIYTLKDAIVDGEDILSDDNMVKSQQDIHAKIYLRRKYSDTDLYFGSMNASYAAVNKNVEMMIRLGTKNRYLNGTSFLNDIFCGPEENSSNPFYKVSVMETVQNTEADNKNILERKIKDFCRLSKSARIEAQEDKFKIIISVNGIEEDNQLLLSPFNSNKEQRLSSEVIFEKMDLLQLSEFYEIRVSIGETSISRIIMIPTTGFPEDREKAVVNSIVNDRRSFVEYVSFVLGDNYLMSLIEEQKIGESGFMNKSAGVIPALYEKMLKTSLDEPERLKEIGYILNMVTDKDIIPDEFRTVYDTFRKTLKIR